MRVKDEKTQTANRVEEIGVNQIEFHDPRLFRDLLGQHDQHVKILQNTLQLKIRVRGSAMEIEGDPLQVELASQILRQLYSLLEKGYPIYASDVDYAVRILSRDRTRRCATSFSTPSTSPRNKRTVTPKSVAQKAYVEAIRNHDIVFGIGPAGTGKTYLAMAMAVAALMREQLQAHRPHPSGGRGGREARLSARRPGGEGQPVPAPALRRAARHDGRRPRAASWSSAATIEVAPLAFMRGRTLNDSFVILDEAQNTTIEQMKMFLTRLGYGSKAVITGDVTQVDLPAGKRSGLSHAVRILAGIDGIRFCYFTERDVVRHPLVRDIIRAYDRADHQNNARDLLLEKN